MATRKKSKQAEADSAPELALEDLAEADKRKIDAMIRQILAEYPHRPSASEGERGAQLLTAGWLREQGLEPHFEAFAFNRSLYQNLLLHFGFATLATGFGKRQPLMAALMHLLAAGSYVADNARWGFLLRRLLPWHPARNLVATAGPQTEPSLRIVLVAHADAAYTGKIFEESFIKGATQGKLSKLLPFTQRSMMLATMPIFGVAAIELARYFSGKELRALRPLEMALTVPALITTLLNADVVLRNQVVPGASDNLSGVAAVALLAERLLKDRPEDVELVFVVTGCEEASLGGADALAKDRDGVWSKENTVVLAVDTLSGGELRYMRREGEIVRYEVGAALEEAIQQTAREQEAFKEMQGFEPPVGGSDALPFLARGFNAAAIVRIDPSIGAPRNYHRPADNADALDLDETLTAIDFVEALCRRLIANRDAE